MEYLMTYCLYVLIVAAGLGLIPANIAKNKGHNFGLWWFYGWMLFIVAIIHVQFIEDYNNPQNKISVAEELKKYHELFVAGAISESEFEQKKKELLNR